MKDATDKRADLCVEALALAAELRLRRADPLRSALAGLTVAQQAFVGSTAREKVACGENMSGKTWTACTDFLAQALGIHPTRKMEPSAAAGCWRGWYATTTFQRFAEQAWGHFKKLLLFPGENELHTPTRRILAVSWDTKSPQRPLYLRLRREDGGEAEVWIKSYEQGAGEFQSAEVDALVLDEECPDGIYEEVQPRVLVRKGQIIVSATPILGVRWLDNLRIYAEAGTADAFHTRFNTQDNPAAPAEEIRKLGLRFKDRPELLALRLGGFPLALEGMVYGPSISGAGPAWTARQRETNTS